MVYVIFIFFMFLSLVALVRWCTFIPTLQSIQAAFLAGCLEMRWPLFPMRSLATALLVIFIPSHPIKHRTRPNVSLPTCAVVSDTASGAAPQVGVHYELSEEEKFYRNALTRMPDGPAALEEAYNSVEDNVGEVEQYVKVGTAEESRATTADWVSYIYGTRMCSTSY